MFLPAQPGEAWTGSRPGSAGEGTLRFVLSRPQDIGTDFIRVLDIEAAPAADLIGVCHAQTITQGDQGTNAGKLLFSAYTSDGRQRLGPMLLGSSDYWIGSCQVSWSGSAFLVTWIEDWADSDPKSPHARIITP